MTTTTSTDVGRILRVPLQRIRPFANQPRKNFDPKELRELADSIGEVGQQVSAQVIALPAGESHGYELVDGERRWRACDLAGVKTLKCEIVDVDSVADQFRRSVASNFGRSDHTPLEIANAVRVLREDGMTVEKVARLFGKSTQWVANYETLLDLSITVVRLLEHDDPEKRLRVTHAFAIAKLPKSEQLAVAKQCVRRSMTTYQIHQYVRKLQQKLGIAPESVRDSYDDWRVLVRFVNRTNADLRPIMDLEGEYLVGLFGLRNQDQIQKFRNSLEELAGDVSVLTEHLLDLLRQSERRQNQRALQSTV